MSQNMLSLEFENLPVRSIVDDSGETLWVAKDICDILGYANHSDALKTHCKGAAKYYPLQTAGGIQEVRVIGESDVFKLISRCTLPAAEKFNNWLFGDELQPESESGFDSECPVVAQVADLTEQVTKLRDDVKTLVEICRSQQNQLKLLKEAVFADANFFSRKVANGN